MDGRRRQHPGGPRRSVVIGASFAGTFAAAALARNGFAVTVLERDRLPTTPRSRPGVPQSGQAHILLHRGMREIEGLLPGFRAELLGRGAVSFDAGSMPWLGEFGWLDTSVSTYEVISATRPLLETVARELLLSRPEVVVREGVHVSGLRADTWGWHVLTDAADASGDVVVDVVVDASGRSSRLDHWLPDLAGGQVELIDARVGYATRLYAEHEPQPLHTGLMILSPPELGTAGLALPVEEGRWLITAAGFGDHRPPRDEVGYLRFLADLRDPALADLVGTLEPAGEIQVHRQTGNQRRPWGGARTWPAGLLVVGDALCAFNPVYGQGITVAAQQARLLDAGLRSSQPVDRRLQRRVAAVTDTPWSIATTADLRQPSCPAEQSRIQRLSSAWAARLGRLAAAGHQRATFTIAAVNHLMVSPGALLHPALLAAAVRPLPKATVPRPTVLDDLARARRQRSPGAPAGA